MKTADILIKNGTIFDPETASFKRGELALRGRRLIDPKEVSFDAEIVDASGCIVTRGLIDMHVHAAQSSSDTGAAPDPVCLPNGVTTAMDAGTTGCASFDSFVATEIRHSITDLRALLHVSPAGMTTLVHLEESDPAYYQPEEMKYLFEKYPDILRGIKTRASKEFIDSEEPLIKAVELAEMLGCFLVVHANDPVNGAAGLAGLLRPGDVFCHMYHGMGDTILDDNGHVKKCIREARERGVVFDSCHGRGNFNQSIARQAIDDGFFPDVISTDMTVMSRYKMPVGSLPRVMSEIHCLGVPWADVFRAVTYTPARVMGLPEKASLAPGSCADISIFTVEKKPARYEDIFGNSFEGDEILIPKMTFRAGDILYRQVDFY